jgi:O-acetyl-ADP-ribose deacetylase (regulator of RNase III)
MKSFDYIFHAVTPKMNKNEDLKKYAENLENLFTRIFLKCELLKVDSIVLPLLGSGENKEKSILIHELKFF